MSSKYLNFFEKFKYFTTSITFQNYFFNSITFIWILGHQLSTFVVGPCFKLTSTSPNFQHILGKSKRGPRKTFNPYFVKKPKLT